MEIREAVRSLIGIAFGGLFACSGLLKLLAFNGFVETVRSYALLPDLAAAPFALAVVIAELALGALLMMRVHQRQVAAMLASLVLLFIVAVSIALVRGWEGECGCLPGIFDEKIGPALLLRDLFILLFLVGLARTRSPGKGTR